MNILTIENTYQAIKDIDSSWTGVYLYLEKGKPIYIGKSVHIKARLLSHYENAKIDQKEAAFVNTADHIEYIQTDSEFSALLLESKLIQTHHPRYNVRWRDDKSYLYIKITVKEDFPKIYLVRKERDGKSKYFGPFSSTYTAEHVLRSIRRVFPYCTQKKIGKHPCFYSKIGLCDPCPSSITTGEGKRKYRTNLRNIVKTLSGKSEVVIKELDKQLKKLSREKKYEEAIIVRNTINHFKNLFIYGIEKDDPIQSYDLSEEKTVSLINTLTHYFPHLTSLDRIECYDISNFMFKEATASMVVYTGGHIDKKSYRRFKIKKPKKISDFDMMYEALERRSKNNWPLPNLIVLDGGKPQVRKILSLKYQNKVLRDIPLIGLAKNPDRIVMGVLNLPTIRLKTNNKGFQMLQHIRDEAHRFAKKYHTYLRDKKFEESIREPRSTP